MREIKKLEVAKLKHGKRWLRRGKVDKAVIEALAGSLKTLGQQVPIIAYCDEILDGNCRWLAAQIAGLTHLDAVVFDHEPTELKLLEVQYAIDGKRSSVPTTQKAAALAAIQQMLGGTVTELAARTNECQSVVTKHLAIDGASDEVKSLLDQGKIDIERAYMLSQSSDPALIQQAPTLTREQLRQKIKAKGKPDVRTSSVRLVLPGGYTVVVRGPEFSMQTLIEVLQEVVKLVKKAMANGHDCLSVQRYLKETIKLTKGGHP